MATPNPSLRLASLSANSIGASWADAIDVDSTPSPAARAPTLAAPPSPARRPAPVSAASLVSGSATTTPVAASGHAAPPVPVGRRTPQDTAQAIATAVGAAPFVPQHLAVAAATESGSTPSPSGSAPFVLLPPAVQRHHHPNIGGSSSSSELSGSGGVSPATPLFVSVSVPDAPSSMSSTPTRALQVTAPEYTPLAALSSVGATRTVGSDVLVAADPVAAAGVVTAAGTTAATAAAATHSAANVHVAGASAALIAAAAAAGKPSDYRVLVRNISLPDGFASRYETAQDVIGNWFFDRAATVMDVVLPTVNQTPAAIAAATAAYNAAVAAAEESGAPAPSPPPSVVLLTQSNGRFEGSAVLLFAKESHALRALEVKKLTEHAIIPVRASPGAAGYDLCSAYDGVVPARGKALLKTDIAIAVPSGTYGRVAPRSGLALKSGIDTGAGVIDEDYRGNVGVILFNHSDADFSVRAGDRIAQLVLEAILTPPVDVVDTLTDTERGAGGFGSTGVAAIVEGGGGAATAEPVDKKPRTD